MKTPEQAITEGFVRPISRLILLFVVSYFAGIFYPLPETVYHLVVGPRVIGQVTITHSPHWVDLLILPLISAPFGKSAILAAPISVICVVLSALDRWSVAHTTALGAISTFSMFFAESVAHDLEWVGVTATFSLSTLVLLGAYFFTRWLIAEHGMDANLPASTQPPSNATH